MKPREWEVMGRCDACQDIFGVVFWVRRNYHNPDKWHATLEKSTTVILQNNQLLHRPGRCNGVVSLYDAMPGPCTLDDE